MACSTPASSEKPIVQAANTAVEFKIDGMTCEMGCVAAIKGQLGKTKGVYKYDINFENKTAVVEFNKEQISAQDVVKTVESVNEGAYKVDGKKTKCIAECGDAPSKKSETNASSSSNEQKISHDSFQIPNIFGLLEYLIR